MLRLLLDEHISPDVGKGRRRRKAISVCGLAEWEAGSCLGLDDNQLLERATAQGLTLVAYDRRTIPPLLKLWAETGREHGGVIFVDEKTIPQSDVGGLIHSLHWLGQESATWDWRNRICFLRRK
jgi:hypothetical protein